MPGRRLGGARGPADHGPDSSRPSATVRNSARSGQTYAVANALFGRSLCLGQSVRSTTRPKIARSVQPPTLPRAIRRAPGANPPWGPSAVGASFLIIHCLARPRRRDRPVAEATSIEPTWMVAPPGSPSGGFHLACRHVHPTGLAKRVQVARRRCRACAGSRLNLDRRQAASRAPMAVVAAILVAGSGGYYRDYRSPCC